MRALITGIAGFAGSHLADLLLAQGFEVRGTVLPGENLWRIEGIRDKIEVYECDLRDEHRVHQVVGKVKPERVYHLAAQSSVGKSFVKPRETYEVNVIGALCLLEALRNHADPAGLRVLLVTSAEVYGAVEEDRLPILETHPLRPISPYAVSKAAIDLMGYQYHVCYGMHIMRVRSFNHIGPRQALGFFVPDLAAQIVRAERKKTAEIRVGNLDAVRDLTDVRDVVRAYWLILEAGKGGEAYNICSGRVRSVKDVLTMLIEKAGVPAKVLSSEEQDKRRATDIPILVGNCEKLKATVAWQPAIEIEDTLEGVLEEGRATLR